jgi:hypothetical protein
VGAQGHWVLISTNLPVPFSSMNSMPGILERPSKGQIVCGRHGGCIFGQFGTADTPSVLEVEREL